MMISKVFSSLPKFKMGSLSSASRLVSSDSAENLLNVEVNDKTGIAIVSLNRPPVNSLSLELLTMLKETIEDLEINKSTGMIITSTNKSIFSGGLDIKEMYKPDADRFRKFWTALQDYWLKHYFCSFPSAAAINGYAPAGGCVIALSCEHRVMCPNYYIGLNETKVSLVVPLWVQALMRTTISVREAEKALTLGTLFTTEEALKVKLIDEIASDKADAIAKCEKFIQNSLKVSQVARTNTKREFRQSTLDILLKNREQDLQVFYQRITKPDVQKEIADYLAQLGKK